MKPKETKTSEFGAGENLLLDQAGRMDGLYTKKPELPESFQGEVFRGKIGVRTFLGLVDGEVMICVTGVTLSVLRFQEAWVLCTHGHQVVNMFHWGVFTPVKQLEKCASDTIT